MKQNRRNKFIVSALAASLVGACMTREADLGALDATRLAAINEKGPMIRTMKVDTWDVEKRTVSLAFSSEAEVPRYFGIEVLDHDPASVDLSRLSDGGALMVNHDWDDQVGVIESVSIDPDRRGRAVVRFGKSERADEIFQDVIDGIRRHVSVGYRIRAAVLQEIRDEDVEVIRVTRWEPYEISIVPVPADGSVGIGRSAEIPQEDAKAKAPENSQHEETGKRTISTNESEKIMIKVLRNAKGDLVRAEVDEAGNITRELETLEKAGADIDAHLKSGSDAERARVRNLMDMGDKYTRAIPKAADLARQAIADGKSPEQLQADLLEAMNARMARPLDEQTSDAAIGMNDNEIRRFSILRAVRALAPNASKADREAAAFEFECSTEAQRAYGKEAKGILVPAEVLGRAFNAGGAGNSPAGANSGSNLIANELMSGSFIEMLRNRATIMRLGSTMGGLVGTVDIPKQTDGATGYWVGEGEDAGEGTPVIGQIALNAKTVAAYTDITRRLMMQSTPDAEGITRRDLANALAQTIDKAGYYGSGSSNQPLGLKNYNGINAVNFAGTQPTFAELVQMETEVASDNADIGQMGYVGNARFRGHCKTTPKFGSGTEATIWEPGGSVNGYRAEITNQLALGDTFFGNFADLIIAMWGGLDLTVDPYSLSKSGGLRIVMFQDVDFNLRRVESICYGAKPAA